MRIPPFLLVVFLGPALCNPASGQNAFAIVEAVKKSQAQLKSISYRLNRTDTLVTGDVRNMSGRAVLERCNNNKPIGFLFWAQRDGFEQQTIYDGRMAYVADTSKNTYRIISDPSPQLFFSTTGGQMIVGDLVRLDTSGAAGITATEDPQRYFLTFSYPDLKEHDVTKRYKLVTVDKKTMLPVGVRHHQETLGKAQDLHFQILELSTSREQQYNFPEPPFLANYRQEAPPIPADNPVMRLKDKAAPILTLPSFLDGKMYPVIVKGKVTLLDFWEVWCAPCIASMPKIQQIYDRYKEKGLHIYGVTHDVNQLEIARKRVKKSMLTFPMLIGDEHSRQAYHVSSIPFYVLIGKDGKVAYLSEGFSEHLEEAIRKALAH